MLLRDRHVVRQHPVKFGEEICVVATGLLEELQARLTRKLEGSGKEFDGLSPALGIHRWALSRSCRHASLRGWVLPTSPLLRNRAAGRTECRHCLIRFVSLPKSSRSARSWSTTITCWRGGRRTLCASVGTVAMSIPRRPGRAGRGQHRRRLPRGLPAADHGHDDQRLPDRGSDSRPPGHDQVRQGRLRDHQGQPQRGRRHPGPAGEDHRTARRASSSATAR